MNTRDDGRQAPQGPHHPHGYRTHQRAVSVAAEPPVAEARQPLAADDPRHGTRNGYTNLGCRCEACRAAATAAHTEWRHRTGYSEPREVVNDRRALNAFLTDSCGTETGYSKKGCRCAACRDASAAARATRRLTPNVKKHNYSGYCNGCRCDECRTAHNEYQRAKRRASATTAAVAAVPETDPA